MASYILGVTAPDRSWSVAIAQNGSLVERGTPDYPAAAALFWQSFDTARPVRSPKQDVPFTHCLVGSSWTVTIDGMSGAVSTTGAPSINAAAATFYAALTQYRVTHPRTDT